MDVEEIGSEWSKELKKGSIQLSILALLSEERKYGFQIIKELRDRTEGFLDLKEGTLYPAMHRLEKLKLLESEWVIEGDSPPRKYYKLTKKGKDAFENAREDWKWMVRGCGNLLGK